MAITGVTDFANGLRHVTVDHDPTATPTDAPKGSLIIEVSTGNHFLKTDDGSSTSVVKTADVTIDVSAHAGRHVDGSDDIQDATAAQKGLATAAQIGKLDGIETSATADQTGAEIKTAYEAEANTNAFTDGEQSKLSGIAAGAEVNVVDSVNTQTGAVVLNADDIANTGDSTWGEPIVLQPGAASVNGTTYMTVASSVIDFAQLPTTLAQFVLRWNQDAVPANDAKVRLFDFTNTQVLGELTPISTTGLKSFTLTGTLPTGPALIQVQTGEVSAGAGTSDISAATLNIGE